MVFTSAPSALMTYCDRLRRNFCAPQRVQVCGSTQLVAAEGDQQKSAVVGISAPGEAIGYPLDRCIRTVVPGKAMADIRQVKHFDCAARFT